jgi:hypothetical protein
MMGNVRLLFPTCSSIKQFFGHATTMDQGIISFFLVLK